MKGRKCSTCSFSSRPSDNFLNTIANVKIYIKGTASFRIWMLQHHVAVMKYILENVASVNDTEDNNSSSFH